MAKVIVVDGGMIGTVDRRALIAALTRTNHDVVICEPEQDRAKLQPELIFIRNLHGFDNPIFSLEIIKKSKGTKRRDRSNRRRKWGI